MAKKAKKAQRTPRSHICHLRVVGEREDNGAKLRIEFELDRKNSLSLAAQIVRLMK